MLCYVCVKRHKNSATTDRQHQHRLSVSIRNLSTRRLRTFIPRAERFARSQIAADDISLRTMRLIVITVAVQTNDYNYQLAGACFLRRNIADNGRRPLLNRHHCLILIAWPSSTTANVLFVCWYIMFDKEWNANNIKDAALPQTDRATQYVSWNVVNSCLVARKNHIWKGLL